MPYRKEKLPLLLKQLAAQFIEAESNRTSLITITNATLSHDGKRVNLFFTVLPDDKEEAVLDFLKRRKRDFMSFIDKKAKIGRMPEIIFSVDKGEKHRQRIDFLLQND